MRKNLLITLLLILPFIVSAQDDAIVLKDFYEKARSIPSSFILNDHVNIMQVNKDNESFEMIAVNDQMQVLWKTELKGYILTGAKFKNKILAVASTDYSSIKSNNNTFKGYLLDPSTGKVLVDKVLFEGPVGYMTDPYVFTGDGDFFKLAIRQNGMERRVHVTTPILFMISNSYSKQMNETRSLDVIDFNDQLEVINKYKPEIDKGDFINWRCNNSGDMFIGWLNGTSLDFVKYNAGKNSPSNKVSSDVAFKKENKDIPPGAFIFIEASKKTGSVLYYSLMYKDLTNKEMELGIGKLDFSSGKKQFVNEVFSKDHIKSLEKAFVPVNKKMDKPDLGSPKNLGVRGIGENNGHLVISLSSRSSSQGTMGVWEQESSTLLNGYDTDLNLKYQQFIPSGYSFPNRLLPSGYYFNKNKLFVISNDKQGMTTMFATYGVLDLTSGKWDKMIWLSKKKISNSDFAGSSSVLWYSNGLIVPYLDIKSGIGTTKYNITLQQNSL
jgi:hypothetical protein